MKTIIIVSDVLTGHQVNGVGTWLINTKKELEKEGFVVKVLDAQLFKYTLPLPSYPEIRMVLSRQKRVQQILEEMKPDYIHIATEGTLGFLARAVCIKRGWSFTTTYHTRFPEYVFARTKLNCLQTATYAYMRWFHNAGKKTHVTTESLKEELESKNFKQVSVIPLGVDTQLFTKNTATTPLELKKPIFVYFGRIAIEKNVEAFLKCNLPGSKLVIGDGPDRESLEKRYKDTALFVGYQRGQDLVNLLSASDVCVFTSKTDTFGLTIIEALSCGLPIAAYEVQGPKNIITNGLDGFLGSNLEESAIKCLKINQADCISTASKYSWKSSTEKFVASLFPR